jgi:TPR repeat protein
LYWSVDLKSRDEKLKQACELSFAPACEQLAQVLQMQGSSQEALKLYDRSCSLGYGQICVALGDMASQNPEDRAKYYAQACQLKNSVGCMKQALVSGADPKPTLLKLCNENFGLACLHLARMKTKDSEVIPLLEKGCRLDERESCFTRALFVPIREDRSQKKKLLSAACDMGSLDACLQLAREINLGGDTATAMPILESSCALAHMESCALLANFASGSGDRAKAFKYFRLACDFGSRMGCDINLLKQK